jgi:enoyl-CoA hydratase/carnithine racemase
MSDGDFTLVKDGHLAIISLNRPDKRNALTGATLLQLQHLSESLAEDGDVRAVIIRAEGKDFSVGADISGMGDRPPQTAVLRRSAEQGARLMRAIREIHQPTICAIQGIATGGAACIATACDFRIAAEGARIGYGEVKLGINLMWNALPLAIELVGNARAKRLVMRGDLVDAETLLSWGFVDELVSRDNLDEAARAMANTYSALPPVAVQMIKRSANACAGALSQAIMHADADQWLLSSRTPDFKEGVASFFEKRPPNFTGN